MKKRKYNRRTLEQQYEHEKSKLARTEAYINRLRSKLEKQGDKVQNLRNRMEQSQTLPASAEQPQEQTNG